MGIFITYILFLSHHWVWETDNLISSFIGSQMESDFAPGWIIVTIITELQNLDGKIWVFLTDGI